MFAFIVYEPAEPAGISFVESEPTGNIYEPSEHAGISFLENLSHRKTHMHPLSLQEYHLKNLSPQNIEKKSPPMNPYTSKTLKSLKGNCNENNLLDRLFHGSVINIGLFNQNNKLLINKELWTKCLFISSIRIMDV